MNTNDITIRLERSEEYREVENLIRESFWNVYRPGCSEHYVIHVLRDDSALAKASDLGFGAVLFEGNINFYGKSGFDYARRFGIRYHDLPEDADDSFFLCKEFVKGYLDGITGVYQTPQGYYVDEAEVETFDKSFPFKEKRVLPGQIFK